MSDTNTFYGYEVFYPGLYSVQEALDIRNKMNRRLWSLVLDLCSAAGEFKYYIAATNATHLNHCADILLSDRQGRGLIEVRARGEGLNTEFSVNNWHRSLKKRGRNRYVVTSKNPKYLINAVSPFLQPILQEADKHANSMLIRTAQCFNSHLNDETNNANNIGSLILQPDEVYAALRTLFEDGFTQAQISPPTFAKIKSTYDGLKLKFANKKSYTERVKDMFDHSKWVITWAKYSGTPLLCIGAVTLTPKSISGTGTYGLAIEKEPRLYRSFDQFYAEHPEDEGSLKAALMFCKVHREKLPDGDKSHDAEGFIPCHYRSVYEDVGGISWCDSYANPSMMSPHVLMLAK